MLLHLSSVASRKQAATSQARAMPPQGGILSPQRGSSGEERAQRERLEQQHAFGIQRASSTRRHELKVRASNSDGVHGAPRTASGGRRGPAPEEASALLTPATQPSTLVEHGMPRTPHAGDTRVAPTCPTLRSRPRHARRQGPNPSRTQQPRASHRPACDTNALDYDLPTCNEKRVATRLARMKRH